MKKTFKTISLLTLALAMMMGMAACSSSDDTADAADDAEETVSYVIYSDTAFAPFEYLDLDSNTYVGVDMDIMAAVAADQGFAYTIENVGFDAAMAGVQGGQADAMIAGMTITAERMESYDFSDGYFEDGQIMAIAAGSDIADLEDLRGTVVATKASTMGYEYAVSIQDEYGFEIPVYEDSPTMYTAVMQGVNSACFEDRTVVQWAIMSEDLSMTTVGDVINAKEYGFAVMKGENAELIELFNAGLANIQASGEYDEILAKYGF